MALTWLRKTVISRQINAVIEEVWEGGTKAFEHEFAKEPRHVFIKLVYRVAGSKGNSWIPDCFKLYWPKLSAAEQETMAQELFETVLDHEKTIKKSGLKMQE